MINRKIVLLLTALLALGALAHQITSRSVFINSDLPMPPEFSAESERNPWRQEDLIAPGVVLFSISGILSKIIWDAKSPKELLKFNTLKPLVISPMIILTVLGTTGGVSLTFALLLAYKSGFFWQAILDVD